ncbi:MAG: DUF5752 family protein [Desulfobacterales bacterium]|jgi:glycosyltransferase involved in cell wall biosynthesis|nr:DUF5752 family protein [Desulfobacterales bacterium]
MANPFMVTDCALIVIATGEKAYNLRDLLDRLQRMTNPAMMYFHFWDGLLRTDFVDPEYQNDLASWVYHGLHDRRLADFVLQKSLKEGFGLTVTEALWKGKPVMVAVLSGSRDRIKL